MTSGNGPGSPVPVVIVGAGPVGLTAAILLARRGIRTVVLERHREPYPLPRAVHLDDEVVRILQAAGVAAGFEAISRPAAGLRLLDAEHRVIAHFRRDLRAGAHGYPPSNLFDQPDLERLLRAELARQPLAQLRTGVEVTGLEFIEHPSAGQPGGAQLVPARAVLVRARDHVGTHTSVPARFVLGCDGAGSTVRELLGARSQRLGFDQRWLVLDLRCPRAPAVWDGVDQICDPRRAATVMWIGADRYRWEFRLHPGETVAELTTPARLARLLAPWTGPIPPVDLRIVRAAEYTFRAELADRWRRGPVFLLGDAAHLTPPFIGQGLGSGLRDVHNLVWKIDLALGSDDSDSLLDSYQDERRPHARALIRLAVTAGWAMTGGQDRAATLRRVLLAGFCRVPGATSLVLDRPGPPLSPGPLVRRRGPGSRIRAVLAGRSRSRFAAALRGGFRDPAGTLVPQPWVRTRTGRHRLDDVLGPGFALLAATVPDPDLLRLADRFGAVVFRVPAAEPPELSTGVGPEFGGEPEPVTIWSAQLSNWLHAYGVGTVLLRPDRVVLASAAAVEW